MTRTWDDKNVEAPLLTCGSCGRSFWVTRPRPEFICVECERTTTTTTKDDDDQSRAGSAVPIERPHVPHQPTERHAGNSFGEGKA